MATQTLYALFQTVSDSERAIGALVDHGIPADHIGIIARRPAEQLESERVRNVYTRISETDVNSLDEPVATYVSRPEAIPPAALSSTITPTSTVDTPDNVETVGKQGITTTTPEDAAAGAAVGTGVGLVTGLLAAAAALMVPGVGLILGGGALAAAIGAAVATTAAGAAVGGVTGYLRDMGMPEQAAERVADRLREGDYLISVEVETTRYDEIHQLLLKYNAAGIDTEGLAAGVPIQQAWANDAALQDYAVNGPAYTNTVVDTADGPTIVSEPVVPRDATLANGGLLPANPAGTQLVTTEPAGPLTVPYDSRIPVVTTDLADEAAASDEAIAASRRHAQV